MRHVASSVLFLTLAAVAACGSTAPSSSSMTLGAGGVQNAGASASTAGGMTAAGMAPAPPVMMAAGTGPASMGGTSGAGAPPMAGMAGMPGGMTGMAGTGVGGSSAAGAPMGGAPSAAGMSAGGMSGSGGADVGGAGGVAGGGGGAAAGGDVVLTAPWDSDEGCSADDNSACGDIPEQYRFTNIGGTNEMPLLSWNAGPEGSQSYVLIYQDLSFLQQNVPFVHWGLWNIPAGTTSVDGDSIPSGANQGSFQGGGWAGSGACGNVYEIVLYALSVDSYMPAGDETSVRDGLDGDDMDLVLSKDAVRGTTLDPCN